MSVTALNQHQINDARSNRWWGKIPLTRGDKITAQDTDAPVEVYRRDIRDLASDIENAKKLVAIKEQELLNAKDQLQRSCKAFVEFCGPDGMKLPISMEVIAVDAPENKPWEFKD